MTSIEPRGGARGSAYDAFEYISHSHTYISDNQPTAKFTYDLSPIQVCLVWCAWVCSYTAYIVAPRRTDSLSWTLS